ncbi:LysR substrate-binding domain-containing protein [Pseudomonas profundi]|uniref:LysR substrate-binding domain-containing protein n=1 Tax=Pseudomonas profundi TaxID=1981513 RepID=UPI00168198AB|nr:LysR substrate-binding domain-containing protein [Pseudomonas profundi]
MVAAPSYLSRYGTPVHAADLSAHVCLRYRFPSSGKLSSWPLIEQGQPSSAEIPESVIANATGALHAMAEAGVGIALLPEVIIADALADGRLVKVLEKQVQDQRNVRLLWPSGRQSLPKVRAFVDFMVDRLGTPDA